MPSSHRFDSEIPAPVSLSLSHILHIAVAAQCILCSSRPNTVQKKISYPVHCRHVSGSAASKNWFVFGNNNDDDRVGPTWENDDSVLQTAPLAMPIWQNGPLHHAYWTNRQMESDSLSLGRAADVAGLSASAIKGKARKAACIGPTR